MEKQMMEFEMKAQGSQSTPARRSGRSRTMITAGVALVALALLGWAALAPATGFAAAAIPPATGRYLIAQTGTMTDTMDMGSMPGMTPEAPQPAGDVTDAELIAQLAVMTRLLQDMSNQIQILAAQPAAVTPAPSAVPPVVATGADTTNDMATLMARLQDMNQKMQMLTAQMTGQVPVAATPVAVTAATPVMPGMANMPTTNMASSGMQNGMNMMSQMMDMMNMMSQMMSMDNMSSMATPMPDPGSMQGMGMDM